MRASFSPDGRHIVCGSEDHFVYIWRTSPDTMPMTVRTDRNSAWERIRLHTQMTTATVFAPRPELLFEQAERARGRALTPLQHNQTMVAQQTNLMKSTSSRNHQQSVLAARSWFIFE
jgi:WD40 repeat protein